MEYSSCGSSLGSAGACGDADAVECLTASFAVLGQNVVDRVDVDAVSSAAAVDEGGEGHESRDVEPFPVEENANAYNTNVLDEVFPYLSPREWLACRQVCPEWNDSARDLMSRQKRLRIIIYYDPDDMSTDTHTSFHSFLSGLSRNQLNMSLLSHVWIDLWSTVDKLVTARPMPAPLLIDFGFLLQHLIIQVGASIRDLDATCRVCPNLKSLEILVDIPVKLEKNELNNDGEQQVSRTMRYNPFYFEEVDQERVILKNLYSLYMTYNVPWAFGDFFATRAPNLSTFHCFETNFPQRECKNLVNEHQDKVSYANELSKMNTAQMKDIMHEYKENKDASNRTSSNLDKLFELDFSSLETCQLLFIKEGSANIGDLHRFLQMISATLQHLDLSLFMYKRQRVAYPNGLPVSFPMLPILTKCVIPHRFIGTPDFFAKMPALKILKICDQLSFKNRTEQAVRKFGFSVENLAMWEVGAGWLPHLKLQDLEFMLCPFMSIPDTLPSMFPGVTTLTVNASLDTYSRDNEQLKKVMHMMKDNSTLTEFTVRHIGGLTDGVLYTAFVLAGVDLKSARIPNNLLYPPETVPLDVIRRFASRTSLRDMKYLTRFVFEIKFATTSVVERAKTILEETCFPFMHNLKYKHVALKQRCGAPLFGSTRNM